MPPSRVPKTKKPEKIRRPPNSWILYRRDNCPEYAGQNLSQPQISGLISVRWNEETEEVRREYARKAEDAAKAHRSLYPDYAFKPVPKAVKAQQKEEAKAKAKEEAKKSSLPSTSGNSSHNASSAVSDPPEQPLQSVHYPNAPPITWQVPNPSVPLPDSVVYTEPVAPFTEEQINHAKHLLFSRGNAVAATNQGIVEDSSSNSNTPAIPDPVVHCENTLDNTLPIPFPAADWQQVNHTFPSASNDVQDSGSSSSSDSISPVYDDSDDATTTTWENMYDPSVVVGTFGVPGYDAAVFQQVDSSVYIPGPTPFDPYLYSSHLYSHPYHDHTSNYWQNQYSDDFRPPTAEEEKEMGNWFDYLGDSSLPTSGSSSSSSSSSE